MKLLSMTQEMIDHTETCQSNDMFETSKDTRLACYSCGNRYRYRRGLIEHIRLRHPSQIRGKADYESNRNFECLMCGKKYSYKRGLLAHIKYRHPEATVMKNKNFVCELCYKRYSYARGLREHIKKQHIIAVLPENSTNFKSCEMPRGEYVRTRSLSENNMKRKHLTRINLDEIYDHFICSVCAEVHTSRRVLIDHIAKRHPDTIETENRRNQSFKCRTCSKVYHCRSSLSTHVRKNHPEKLMMCIACNRTFVFRAKLFRHLQKKHVIAPKEESFKRGVQKQPAIRICPVCLTSYSKKAQIVDHLASAHDIELQCESLHFDDAVAFNEWKRATEVSTCSRYVLSNRYQSDIEYVTHFVCHRSGLFCTKSKRIRNIRRVVSKKINSFCPAEIRLRVKARSGQHVVDWCSTHIGHDNGQLRELRYFKASKDERVKIWTDLPASDGLRVVATPTVPDLSRVSQFVVCELDDVGCVTSSLDGDGGGVGVAQSNELTKLAELVADDLTDADIDWWIDENADFVFYYKGKHVADPHHPELEDADFVLVIMDGCQLGMLKSFGANIVAVDRIRAQPSCGDDGDDYAVFTLSVIDELYLEFVCVYMFSSRDDELVYRLLFEKLRQQVGAFQTRVFMSDVSDVCANAWSAIMPAPGRRLYCDQHVHQDWLRHLGRVAALQKRQDTRLFLTTLKNELNVYRFHERLDAWSDVHDPDLYEFRRYFEEAYAKCASRWAYCYRKHAGVSVSMAATRFMAKGRKKRADDDRTLSLARALNVLSETMRDFYAEKLRIETDAKLVPKMRDLRWRHCAAMKHAESTRLINQLTDTQWYVPSLSAEVEEEDGENLVHCVELVKPACDCSLRCESCDACLHTYFCACMKNCIEFEMCEHIHLVCLFRQQNASIERAERMAAVSADVENVAVEVEVWKTTCADEARIRPALVDLINDPMVQKYG